MSQVYKELLNFNKKQDKPTRDIARETEKYFTKKAMLMATMHMKICSMSLTIREIQIKFTVNYCFTSTRMTKIQNTGNGF